MAQDGDKKASHARVTIRLPVTTEKGRRGRFRLVPPPGHDQAPWWRRLTPFHLALVIIQLFLLAAIVQYVFFKEKPVPGRLLPTPAGLVAAPPVMPPGSRPMPASSEPAVVMPGLKAVAAALLPNPAGLAPGSAEAQARQVALATRSGLPLEVENSIGMRFRLVPPGSFIMGSPAGEKGRWEGEAAHAVTIYQPFYMGRFEVTQAQWIAILGRDANPSFFREAVRPVEEVNWYQCVEFANALCKKEGVPEGTYRLPVEKEWEYACRAGTRTAWCFGDDPARLRFFADFIGNNDSCPNLPGRRLPNAWGLHDMHGNVWEWCQDKYQPYDPALEPVQDENDPKRIAWELCRNIRGGTWHADVADCRSATRARLGAESFGNMLGLRLVRMIPEYSVNARDQAVPPDWLRPAPLEPAPAPPSPLPPLPPVPVALPVPRE